MNKQSETTLNLMDELMKQIELFRTRTESKKTYSPNESSSKDISYTKTVKLSPIIMKPTSSKTPSNLDKIKVTGARVTENEKKIL